MENKIKMGVINSLLKLNQFKIQNTKKLKIKKRGDQGYLNINTDIPNKIKNI